MKIFSVAPFIVLFSAALFAQDSLNIIWEADAKAETINFSPDGLSLYSGGLEYQNPYSYGNIRKWDVLTKNLLYTIAAAGNGLLGYTNDIAVSPDENFISSGHGDIYCVPPSGGCYNSNTGFYVFSSMGSTFFYPQNQIIDGIVTGVSFSSNSDFVAMGMRRTLLPQINIYRTYDYQLYHAFTINSTGSYSLAFSPVENILASGEWSEHIHVWDLNTKELLHTLQTGDLPVSLAFSPDGNLLAAGPDGYNTIIKVWDVHSGNLMHSFEGIPYGKTDVAFSPNGEYLAAGFKEYSTARWMGRIKIWRLSDGQLVKEFTDDTAPGVNSGVNSIAFSSIGTNWFAYAYDNKIKFAQTDLLFNSVTPVELAYFKADILFNSVYLKWETSSELNNKGFEIERKQTNEKNWSILSFIPGQGTTTDKHVYVYDDETAVNDRYIYRLKQIDHDGSYKYSHEINVDLISPNSFLLLQNYPNPFNPSTKIRYRIPGQGNVKLQVFDVLGNETATLVNEIKSPGEYEIEFNAGNLSSGVYVSRLTFKNNVSTIKLILSK